MTLPFLKMHGAGNDFVIFDARHTPLSLTAQQVREVSSRDNPATRGCDQLIVLEPSDNADAFMRIYNADGSQVDACGNATRCIADILEKELGRLPVRIETNAGILQGLSKGTIDGQDYIRVDMGQPKLGWQDIPLAMPLAEAAIRVKEVCGLIEQPHFISMGNPHVVFFLAFDAHERSPGFDSSLLADIDLVTAGSALEQARDIFPEGVNVTIATLQAAPEGNRHLIHARVWERGAGLTQACGTAACALLAAARQRHAAIGDVTVCFEPFLRIVNVRAGEDGHMLLGGPVTREFEGRISL
jgi:diaminopimelate epimerase